MANTSPQLLIYLHDVVIIHVNKKKEKEKNGVFSWLKEEYIVANEKSQES